MTNNANIKLPPRHKGEESAAASTDAPTKFKQIAEDDIVQFNKRIKSRTADGFAMLSIKTKRKTPELLDEALALLEEKYGKV